MKKTSNNLIPASTVLIIRNGKNDLEVFMVVRHHQIDFASGALVFPGGKVDSKDIGPDIRDFIIPDIDYADEELSFRIAAIRESYEESGMLFAKHKANENLINNEKLEELQKWRDRFNKNETSMQEFAKKENLKFSIESLIPFAHWITPDLMPKRFDTRFYLAAVPDGHQGTHDGKESVDSLWISPKQAIEDCLSEKRTIIFPTRMNLEKLRNSKTVDEALSKARKQRIVTVLPKLEKTEEGVFLTIPKEAGYGDVKEPLENLR